MGLIEHWFEFVVILFFAGIYARLWFVIRDVKCIHDLVHEIHDHVFMKTGDVQVSDGENFHVMSLDDFVDRFGFDPTEPESDNSDKADTATIEAWDNAKV